MAKAAWTTVYVLIVLFKSMRSSAWRASALTLIWALFDACVGVRQDYALIWFAAFTALWSFR